MGRFSNLVFCQGHGLVHPSFLLSTATGSSPKSGNDRHTVPSAEYPIRSRYSVTVVLTWYTELLHIASLSQNVALFTASPKDYRLVTTPPKLMHIHAQCVFNVRCPFLLALPLLPRTSPSITALSKPGAGAHKNIAFLRLNEFSRSTPTLDRWVWLQPLVWSASVFQNSSPVWYFMTISSFNSTRVNLWLFVFWNRRPSI